MLTGVLLIVALLSQVMLTKRQHQVVLMVLLTLMAMQSAAAGEFGWFVFEASVVTTAAVAISLQGARRSR